VKSATTSLAASVTSTRTEERRADRATSRASATRVPFRPGRTNCTFAFTATATVPWELQQTAKAKSASVKIAPPWANPTAFMWRSRTARRARA
jgi:hypothetical protein